MPYLSLIVPVYNEEENLPLLYEAVIDALKPIKKDWELILVDDGSRGDAMILSVLYFHIISI